MPGSLRFGVVSDKSRKEGHGRCWCKGVRGFKAKTKAKGSKKQSQSDLIFNIKEDVDIYNA